MPRVENSDEIILASASPVRATMLRDAGIECRVVPAEIDERSVEDPLLQSGALPADIAEVLARAKAEDVSGKNSGQAVIGCDQVLSLDEEILHKPKDMEEARRRLLLLSGKTHQLHSAVCLAIAGETTWTETAIAHITFRKLDPGFVGRHLAAAGQTALESVGAYQIEGRGVQLIERIEGDFFTVMGLPLLPLLAQLRAMSLIDG